MLDNEFALVTGATRGIGRAIALELGRRGARVVGTATSEAGAIAIGTAFTEAGLNGRGVVLDVSNAESVERCFKDLEAAEGTPSILVNNAGVTRDGLLMRMSAEDWQAVLDTDLTAVYRTCKAVMRGMMKARRGDTARALGARPARARSASREPTSRARLFEKPIMPALAAA